MDRTKKIRLINKIAKIWSLPIIIYALMMIIGYLINTFTTGKADPYIAEEYPFIENLPPIFMFFAVMGLGIAWRWEKLGSIINIIFCTATLPILLIHWPITNNTRYIFPYLILLIIFLPGVFFLVHWYYSGRK